MPNGDESALSDLLAAIAERISAKRTQLSERDVETIFFDEDFFSEFGFDSPGIDVLQERTLADRTRPDVITLQDSTSVRAVYEFKEPTEPLSNHTTQLRDYVSQLEADAGVLTNGLELQLFSPDSGSITRITTITLARATENAAESDLADLRAALGQEEWSYTNQDDLNDYLNEVQANPLHLNTVIAQSFFFDTFRFDRQGSFGKLVEAGMDLLEALRESDAEFTTGAFDFWQRSYARLPDEDDVPRAWEPFVMEDGDLDEDKLAAFMFTLESGFALLSRLFLMKAADDHNFFVEEPVQSRLESLGGHSGEIEPADYVETVQAVFGDLRGELIESLFEDDIFFWWRDGFRDSGSGQLGRFADLSVDAGEVPAAVRGPRDRFATAVAKLLLGVLKFDFSRVDNVDLLGGLYQNYFDEDTRKALGEFYTPSGVVDLILDRVEYPPTNDVSDARLVDPACGSGTFLSDAIERYLADVRRRADGDPDWQAALEDLCLEPRIVGFDIHPFAVLMAEISFTLSILEPYQQAKQANSSFTIRRLPIFRTDTLQKESHDPGADLDGAGQQTITGSVSEDSDIEIPIELPLEIDDSSDSGEDDAGPEFIQTTITLPRYDAIRDLDSTGTGVDTYGDYFRVLLGLMDVVKAHVAANETSYTPACASLARGIESYLDRPIGGLESFMEPYVASMLSLVAELEEYGGGGRLLPIFEDVALSLIVKNHLEYDYVIANPPYVEANNIDSETKQRLEEMYPETTTGKFDLYCPFYQRAVDWLREGGSLGFITPNQFMVTEYGQGVRDHLADQMKVQELYDFRDSGVFADATNYPVVVVAEKDTETGDSTIHCGRVKRVDDELLAAASEETDGAVERPTFGDLQAEVVSEAEESEISTIDTSLDERVLRSIRETFDETDYTDDFVDIFEFDQSNLRSEYWCPMPADEWAIFTQIEGAGDALFDGFLDLHAGTQTGRNSVYIVTPTEVDRIDAEETGGTVEVVPKGGGEPVTLERDLLRPWLQGSDVKRWRPEWSGEHVIFPYKEVQGSGGTESQPLDPDEMQALEHTWNYLTQDEIRESLESREGGMMEGREHWYAFTAPKSHIDLSRPKVIAAETAGDARFAFDDDGSWLFKSAYGAPFPPEFRDRREYLTAYLNSCVFDFYLKHVSSLKSGGHYKYTTNYVGRVPVISDLSAVPDEMRTTIESIVDQLVEIADTRLRVKRFPESYPERIDGELRTLDYTWENSYDPISSVAATVGPAMDYQVSVEDGEEVLTHQSIADGGETAAEYVVHALRDRSVSEGETIRIHYPTSPEELEILLTAVEEDQSDLQDADIEALESELNECFFSLFDLDDAQQETIDSFLEAYSDRSS